MDLLIPLLGIAHAAIIVAASLRLLLREDITASARLAWVIVLASLPVLGLIAYIAIGEIRLPARMKQRRDAAYAALRAARPDVFEDEDGFAEIPRAMQKPFRFAASVSGFQPMDGNTARFMPREAEAHAALIADIDAARESISLMFYIWLDDGAGSEIAEALIRARKRGVTVRAAADNLGSRKFVKSALWKRMQEAGVHLQIAMPFESIFGISLITRFDLRNHRKLVVIDGEVAHIGSRNGADPEFAPKRAFGPWIDVMLSLEGPVVNQVQALFFVDWSLQEPLAPADLPFRGTARSGGFAAQYHGTGPLERPLSSSQIFCSLFELAQKELVITTPYFVPDNAVANALQSAAWRGVDVTLNLPEVSDSWVVKCASRGHYQALLEAGVRIMEHRPGLLHAKLATIDREVALIGSSNLDQRSFDLNFESDLMVYSSDFATEIHGQQQEYISQSRRVTLDEISGRSKVHKLRDNLVATLGPIL